MEIRRMFNQSILIDSEQVPFIACCTAYVEASFRGKALEAGMDHFLTKPFDQKDLNLVMSHLT